MFDAAQVPVLYEDADLIVVDKPAGIATIPERDRGAPSLVESLSQLRAEKLFVVHRLDKEVSGALLFARSAEAHRRVNDLFAAREVHKSYVAWLHGALGQSSGQIDLPLREFGSGRVGVDRERGKPCLTRWELDTTAEGFSRVVAHPVTGRRHQLRAHFYAIGHPIAGDLRYGDRAAQVAFPRLLLHAWRIELPGASGAGLTVTSPLPPTFERAPNQ